jgi:hypothetical protein
MKRTVLLGLASAGVAVAAAGCGASRTTTAAVAPAYGATRAAASPTVGTRHKIDDE